MICAAEDADFPPQAFDVVSCAQSWQYFDQDLMIPRLKTWLKPGGKLLLTRLAWLPRKDCIAPASERLVLRYNPQWLAAGFAASCPVRREWCKRDLHLVASLAYEEGLPFTRDSWRGRIRACRGIGASLSAEDGERFDREHAALLQEIAAETFTVLHQIWLQVYEPRRR
jgi:hypothetical protein